MGILEKIKIYSENNKDKIAIYSENSKNKSITYQELWDFSDRLAFYIQNKFKDNKSPIVVYGHKDPFMIVCFLACVKSGRAYCPVDISVPDERVKDIISETKSPVIFALEKLNFSPENAVSFEEIESIIKSENNKISESCYVKNDDVFYIIFTSGSTGKPKGVQITLDCLNNFLKWSSFLGGENLENKNYVYINQAPFSFDLSVMDLYTSLYTGGTLWCLEKKVQMDYNLLIESLKKSGVNVWVSTPSFANLCLALDDFNAENIPDLKLFLFCGETLPNLTAKLLLERFPKAKVINTYGPTESTVAMTEIDVTPEVLDKYSPLPVGKPKNGTHVFIMDEKGSDLPEGEKGEIVIVGDTVSVGYFKRPDITKKSFGTKNVNGKTYRLYRTGDEGYFKDGQLFYCGRIDLQIKLHGYRIELEDIENNLMKIKGIKNAVVIPVKKDGIIDSLTAFVAADYKIESSLKAAISLKKELSEFLPPYMVPKKIIFKDKIPMTNNGKVNRKKLMEEL
ncbi:MAG: D-alanine--poly(phosphoribitol) ligase subunit DltA [Clostridia bacterium]|nr:D-alanine--poly(phosphoribitol) ligase subunit DltA [Clostridia bacterium]